MSEKKFNCVEFDDENKRLNILIGDEGIIHYKDIQNVAFVIEKEFKSKLLK